MGENTIIHEFSEVGGRSLLPALMSFKVVASVQFAYLFPTSLRKLSF